MEDVRKSLGEFVEKLLSLVPPYDMISMFSRECNFSGNFRELSVAHPEFFNPEVFSVIQRLLGLEIRSSGEITLSSRDGVGYYLNYVIGYVYEILDDDNFRDELSRFVEKQIPNPLEEYIKTCIDAVKQQDDKMIEVLRILTTVDYCSAKELKVKLDDKGIKVDEKELQAYVRTLSRLGLVETSWYSDGSYSYKISSRKRRHLKKYL